RRVVSAVGSSAQWRLIDIADELETLIPYHSLAEAISGGKGLAPDSDRVLAESDEALPLGAWVDWAARDREQRCGRVAVPDELRAAQPGRQARAGHDERYAQAMLVEALFAHQAVLSQRQTVIGRIDHNRVLRCARPDHSFEDVADRLVEVFDHPVVIRV